MCAEAMGADQMVTQPRELLRRLARHDEPSLRTVLAPLSAVGGDEPGHRSSLDRQTRLLVHLAALLVADASTDSLRWAVDLAFASGADDDDVAAVLIAAGSAAGSAQLVVTAPRLALAMGYEPVQWALATDRADQRPELAPPPPTSMRRRACGTPRAPAS
jgi:hypothetical protein